jgi:S-adenosylmethionine synthetase
MMMGRRLNIVVQVADRGWADGRGAEMCEHKGVGHPDTIADAVCEAAAQGLAGAYMRAGNGVMHFNVDKGLLIAGRSEPRFRGGKIIERPKLIVCGRASNPEGRLRIPELIIEAGRHWLEKHLHVEPPLIEVVSEVKEGSASLQRVFAAGAARANDTSFGVGYAPLSELEEKVLALADMLRSDTLREDIPAAGRDFKIMGLRLAGAFTFTVAVALIDRYVASCADYFEVKQRIREALSARLERADTVLVNQLDDPESRDERGLHLTVTGLSAEMGDDGQVGRGNRVNGLITPDRPMSLEAAAGKNPYSHVGKIYNVLAHRIARKICEDVPEISESSVRLLSMIGRAIDEPQAVIVDVTAAKGGAVQERVAVVVENQLDAIGDLTAELARGNVPVY